MSVLLSFFHFDCLISMGEKTERLLSVEEKNRKTAFYQEKKLPECPY